MLVDMHNFILPIDNAPGDDAAAIRLAKKAVENGITHIIATPRSRNKGNIDLEQWIKFLVKNLNKKFFDQSIPLTLLEGMKIHLNDNLIEELENHLIFLGGTNKYILVELPKNQVPTYTQSIFFQLQLKGYIPIIAHPEQNSEIIKDPNILFKFVSRGALVQLNAASIVGLNGRVIKRFVKKLCWHNLVHFVTSDSHEDEKKTVILLDAYKFIEKNISEEFAYYLQENLEHIVKGTDFHVKDPIQF